MTPAKRMHNRLERLQGHLERENPILVSVIGRYRKMDAIAQKIGLKKADESYATQISWWPLISILGTFSAGKSSFINSYLRLPMQDTGNQAVDDKFTVATYSSDSEIRTLPGIALDGDPRFPFYQISEDIENVTRGEGAKIDNYLQMKAAPSEKLRGKILIDSPGFDADEQRKATLKITDHIIDISDLVLVLFDARHPEPGAMQDTLEHLVRGAQRRNDSSKFLFILNQIDTSAKEDNMEQIVAAWQKALVQSGLNTGRFYVIFNKDLATPVSDQAVWDRYVNKRDEDYTEITKRMDDINIERVYRIIGSMESLSNQVEQQAIPQIKMAMKRWKKRVLITDGLILVTVLVGLLFLSVFAGYWQGLSFNPPWLSSLQESKGLMIGMASIVAISAFVMHMLIRGRLAAGIAKKLSTDEGYGDLSAAFLKNTRWWRSIFRSKPVGWSNKVRSRLDAIRSDIDQFVQSLNDRYTSPAGDE
ncbi:EH domain-containing protein 4 [Nymphon striatum]|nr:EH domain-containing protein 4 [Nymphon striatum]